MARLCQANQGGMSVKIHRMLLQADTAGMGQAGRETCRRPDTQIQ